MIELTKIFKENPVLFSETDKQKKRISAKTVLEAEFSLIWFHFMQQKRHKNQFQVHIFLFFFSLHFLRNQQEREREREREGERETCLVTVKIETQKTSGFV